MVTAVIFHPNSPFLLTGGEDGAVGVINTQTWRAEQMLSFGMQRAWTIATRPGSHQVSIGFDNGMIMLDSNSNDIKEIVTDIKSNGGSQVPLIEVPATKGTALDYGSTPLHRAACQGLVTNIEELLATGLPVNATDKEGSTPLHCAAQGGCVQAIEALITKGASINSTNKYGTTPLHCAAQGGHVAAIEALVAKGAAVDAEDKHHHTPLQCAVHSGHIPAIKALIAKGAPVHSVTKSGQTPLHCPAQDGNVLVIKALIDNGARVDATLKEGLTPLHLAAYMGHVEAIKMLVDRGATVGAKNILGTTPLHCAAENGQVSAIMALIASTTDGGIPLCDANINTSTVLIVKEPAVDVSNNRGDTPLHIAAYFGQVAAIKALIKLGADVNATNHLGQTPLYEATCQSHASAIQELIVNGATTHSRFFVAVRTIYVLRYLILAGTMVLLGIALIITGLCSSTDFKHLFP